ncbi:MAG: YdcF family protein [Thermodesulfobacteriota bacterium]
MSSIEKKKTLRGLLIYAYALIVTLVIACQLLIMYTPLVNVLASNLLVDADIRRADVIIVLAGGAYDDGSLGSSSMKRTVHATELYKKGFAGKIIFSGGNMLRHHLDVTISERMAEFASKIGVPNDAQIVEKVSLRTYGNAVETKNIMDENGFNDALLVTSATHMKRAMLTFEHLEVKVYPAPTLAFETTIFDPVERFVMFKVVMREYVGMLLYKWKGWI